MRRLLVNSLAVLGLILSVAIAGEPPECGLWCYDPQGNCADIPCPMIPGSCRVNSDCCEGQLCRPGCIGPTVIFCHPQVGPGPYAWAQTFDCAGLCIPIPEPTGPRGYTIQDVGTFGGPESQANGINNLSQVVGWADTPSWEPHGFIWRPGDIRLTDYAGGITDINDRGQSFGPIGVWYNGVWTPLGGQNPNATAINDLGHLVGRFWNRDAQENHGALWIDYSQPIDLSQATGEHLWPEDVNNAGQIVGSFLTPEGWRAFLLDDGVVTNLGTLDGRRSAATSINDLGHVAGYVSVPNAEGGGFTFRGVTWTDGPIYDIQTPVDPVWGAEINNCGEVLTARGLFHLLYGAKNTEDLFPAEALWFNLREQDMNDYGEIVGWGDAPGAGIRGFYMRPTPGDLYPDGNIDLKDMTLFAHHWANKLCLRTDVNRDGVSDLRDFARFQIIFGGTTLLPKAKND